MHRNPIWAVVLGPLIVGLGPAISMQAAPRQGACAEIRALREQAGFVRAVPERACIAPIIQHTPQPPSGPLPKIDPQLVSACKAQNPNFGHRKRLSHQDSRARSQELRRSSAMRRHRKPSSRL